MKTDKLMEAKTPKRPWETARAEMLVFSLPDIVTTSGGDGSYDDDPNQGEWSNQGRGGN